MKKEREKGQKNGSVKNRKRELRGWLGVKYLQWWFTAVSVYSMRCVGVGETCIEMERVSVNASSWCEWLKEQLESLRWSESELTVYTWQNHQQQLLPAALLGPLLSTLANLVRHWNHVVVLETICSPIALRLRWGYLCAPIINLLA